MKTNNFARFLTALSFLIITLALTLYPKQSQSAETSCTFAREYITTLEFIRSQKILTMKEPEAQQLAMKISHGCNGAAQRFVKTTTVLRKSGLSAKDSVQLGLEFSGRTDAETETFHVVFLTAFLEESLNLDLLSALKLARSLSTEFKGDTLSVRRDFSKLVQFCVDERHLNLPRPQCADFAARLAKQGEKWETQMAGSFIELYTFLRSENGPNFTTGQALPLAEKLMAGGQDASHNFIQAYRYAVASQGLSIGARDAILFAQKITLLEPQAPLKSE